MTKNMDTKTKKPPRARGAGCIFTPKHSRYLWLAYTDASGKRRYVSTRSESKTKAQTMLNDILGKTGQGEIVLPKYGKLTVAEGLKAVLDDQRLNNRQSADQTAQRIEDYLLPYFGAKRPMNTISTADVAAYQAKRVNDDKMQPASVNRELAILRRAFRLAVRHGLLPTRPDVPMLHEDNTRTGFLEREQLDAILKHVPAYMKSALEFMYTTGWRKSEVLTLTIAQVNLDAGTVVLHPGETKNKQGRTFVLTSGLHALLTKQLASIARLKKRGIVTAFVFHQDDGTALTKDVRAVWEAARVAAGYPQALLHDFRRSAVRNLERAGVPRTSAMKMVGHQTESIYRRYAIQDEAMLREAAAKLDAWQIGQTPAKATGQLRAFAGARRPRTVRVE